jgi:hypothetical protein
MKHIVYLINNIDSKFLYCENIKSNILAMIIGVIIPLSIILIAKAKYEKEQTKK